MFLDNIQVEVKMHSSLAQVKKQGKAYKGKGWTLELVGFLRSLFETSGQIFTC